MIRKSIIVVLTLAAVGAVFVEVWSFVGPCPIQHAHPLRRPCPVRVHLGRSDRGPERFVYAVSHSWYSTVGYLRWFIYESNGKPWEGCWDDEGEGWFHAGCIAPMVHAGGRIARVVRADDIPPSHVFQRALVVPRGFFFLMFGAYPTVALIRGPVRRRRRRRRGLCTECGYDLTGNESGVCAECGSCI